MHEGWLARGANVFSYTIRESEAPGIWKKFQITIYEIWMFSQNSRIINGLISITGISYFLFSLKGNGEKPCFIMYACMQRLLMHGRWKYRKTPHHALSYALRIPKIWLARGYL